MAVTVPPAVPPAVHSPGSSAVSPAGPTARHFVRLKLRLLGNAMRGSTSRTVAVVIGLAGGLAGAVLGFAAFAAGSAAPSDPDVRFAIVTGLGAALTAGWLLLPLLFFGVDETLDPARFALLPLPRRVLARGMLAAACIGIPAVATLLALLGLVVGGAVRGGAAAALFAAVVAVTGLLECVVLSRAVTSAFATMLRSRRMRDLAAITMAVLASSIAPLQIMISVMVERGDVGRILGVIRFLAWTPLGAPYAAAFEATEGRWGLAGGRLAIGVATIPALLWWWSKTLEPAMFGAASGGPGGRSGNRATGQAVASLFPAALSWLPAGRFSAVVARELRYWVREPRRRAAVASLVLSSSMVPLMLRLPFITSGREGTSGTPLPVAVVFSSVLVAVVLANQFGTDGTAYAAHLLTGVVGRAELLARGVALAVFGVPLLVAVTVVTGVVSHAAGAVPAALGTATAAFGVSLGIASVISVLAPYPMPDSSSPFAMNSGSGSAKGLLSLLAVLAASAASAPILVGYALLPAAWSALLAPVGVVWGVAGALLGATIGGDLLDRRGPEVLLAVTPRR